MDKTTPRITFGQENVELAEGPVGNGSPSVHKRKVNVQEGDAESCFSDDGNAVRESDFKKRQVSNLTICECSGGTVREAS